MGYHEADLRLCFRICKMLVFSRRGSVVTSSVSGRAENEKLAKTIKIGSKVNGIESLKIERSPGKVLEFHFY